MDEKEMVQRNTELSTEFSRYLFEHPEFEEQIPAAAEIVLLPEFDLDLKDHNLKLGRKLEETGAKVTYIRISRLRSKTLSSIGEAEVESPIS